MKTKAQRRSRPVAVPADVRRKLKEIWPTLGPFPYLRTLEVMLAKSPSFTAEDQKTLDDMFRLIRSELRERSAVTEAESAFLRILRALSVDVQKEFLLLILEKAVRMPTSDAEAFVGSLNFVTLGTGGGR